MPGYTFKGYMLQRSAKANSFGVCFNQDTPKQSENRLLSTKWQRMVETKGNYLEKKLEVKWFVWNSKTVIHKF